MSSCLKDRGRPCRVGPSVPRAQRGARPTFGSEFGLPVEALTSDVRKAAPCSAALPKRPGRRPQRGFLVHPPQNPRAARDRHRGRKPSLPSLPNPTAVGMAITPGGSAARRSRWNGGCDLRRGPAMKAVEGCPRSELDGCLRVRPFRLEAAWRRVRPSFGREVGLDVAKKQAVACQDRPCPRASFQSEAATGEAFFLQAGVGSGQHIGQCVAGVRSSIGRRSSSAAGPGAG